MNIIIHRGQNQIGGNIIEISTSTTKILLDVGLELDTEETVFPDIDGLFDNADFDAVFISHYHSDHVGLAYFIDKNIPIYMGKGAFKIIKAVDDYHSRETLSPKGFLKDKTPIIVGDIKVTPYLCDHSAFDSYMLFCEADGENVLYTGDFRSNGRKSFDGLLDKLPKKVDKLICEGTTLSRENKKAVTEWELENQATKIFKETTGPIFVYQANTNIDRIVTMYRAANQSNRNFLENIYMAEITSALGGSIPNPGFSDVYAFLTFPEQYENLQKFRHRIGRDSIAEKKFVMCVLGSMTGYLKTLSEKMPFKNGILVYSMWHGYKDNPRTAEFLKTCENMGLKIVDLHTTGHADHDTIRKLIEAVKPDDIIPVHTEAADWFSENYKTL